MGHEPTRKGKRLYVHLAGILILGFILSSCAVGLAPPVEVERPSAERHLVRGQCLLAKGDYAGARRHADHVLQEFPGQADDRALHLKAMVLVHPDNPQGDLQAGAHAFGRIVADYPDSPLMANARTWLAMLARMKANQLARDRLDARNRSLEKGLNREIARRLMLEERLQQLKAVDLSVE